MHPADLERLVDSELRRLPAPQAPRTLLPRVLSVVQDWSLRPWYARAWFTWPVAWQAAALGALATLVGGGLGLIAAIHPDMPAGSSAVSAVNDVATFVGRVAVMVEAVLALCRTLLTPFSREAFAFVVLMFGACAVFGWALSHVIVERCWTR